MHPIDKNPISKKSKRHFYPARSIQSDEQTSPKQIQEEIVSKSSDRRLSDNKKQKNINRGMINKQNKKWNIFLISIFLLLCLFLIGFTTFLKLNGAYLVDHLRSKQILVIFIGLNGNQDTYSSLSSFLDKNDYPIKTFICIVKSIPDQKIYQNNQNFIWIIQDDDRFLYGTIDKILDQYKMQYFFYFDDQWRFLKGGFINYSLQLLEQFSSSQQILLHDGKNKLNEQVNPKLKGFSFSPGLHRRGDFFSAESKFSTVSEEAIKKKSTVEFQMSKKFTKKYMYALATKENFVQKIRNKKKDVQNRYYQIGYDSNL